MNPAIPTALAFAIIFPVGLLIWWKKKTGESLWCFIAGAICFILFAYILESLLHQFCVFGENAAAKAISGSPFLYMLYGAFAAGIFEETGRFFGFKLLLKRHQEKECSVAYGIGHGGVEVILVLGMTYAVYLLGLLGVQFGDAETTAQVVAAANSIPIEAALIAMFERISAMMLHIGLSMIVFTAARDSSKLWLYPTAILLHALADAPACLFQKGVIKSLFVIEALAFIFGIAVLIIGKKILDSHDPDSASPCNIP